MLCTLRLHSSTRYTTSPVTMPRMDSRWLSVTSMISYPVLQLIIWYLKPVVCCTAGSCQREQPVRNPRPS
jgi:hypothetical protein